MSKANVEDIYPLSPAQQAMLLYQVLSGERSKFYFDQFVIELGHLDPGLLRQAWQAIVERHAALRTFFVWENRDQPLQVVRKQIALPWAEHDLSRLDAEAKVARIDEILRADHAQGFDPAKAPLMRVTLLRLGDGHWKMVWSFSHLILDGWSLPVVMSEVDTVYRALRVGKTPELPPVRPYRDFIGWLKRQDLDAARVHWQTTLAGFEPPTPLPYDGTGGHEPHHWVVREATRYVDADRTARLHALCRQLEITPNTLFQGLWSLLLARSSGKRDVVFAGIVSGRPYELEGVESMVGLFINALPVRVAVDERERLTAWLERLQAQQFEQRAFEYCSYDQIREWAGLPRQDLLFESVLVFENYPQGPGDDAEGLRVQDARLTEAGNLPMTLFVNPTEDRYYLRLTYHWERFGSAGAARIVDALFALLDQVLARPEARLGELDPLSAAERAALVALGQGEPRAAEPIVRARAFETRAAAQPSAPAVVSNAGTLTYAELDARANQLARHLVGLGVVPETLVALAVERSLEMVVAMLAITKAGAGYLPLDPAYPADRLAYMLEDSGARWVLTQEPVLAKLPVHGLPTLCLDRDWSEVAHHSAEPFAVPIDLANLAYVIYTSGSTGKPKGVAVEQRSLASYTATAAEAFSISPGDRVLQFASISFDTSAEEIYPALTQGATLVLRDDAMVASFAAFGAQLEALGITVLDLPTAYWHEWVAALDEAHESGEPLPWPSALRLVILGGEQAQKDRLASWLAHAAGRVRLVNTYGPTEATIVSTHRELPDADFAGDVPIGRAVPAGRTYVVDPALGLVARGLEGELAIGGSGVTRGYLGRPALTAERFVPDAFSGVPGARLYRSGDRVRWTSPGANGADEIVFRGRGDAQVKVRGYRIELGEIEIALRAQPGVKDAVVLAQSAPGGGNRLVAGFVPSAGSGVGLVELRAGLGAVLPAYMVPSAFVELAELPTTPAGKVDRRAVAKLLAEASALGGEGGYAAPRTPAEEMLAGIWAELLGRERIGRTDDFFQLGGHSLLVAKLAVRVRQAFGVELPMIEVFKTPTVEALAQAIEKAESADGVPQLPPLKKARRDRPIPLSYPQERVWVLNQLAQGQGGNIAYNFQVTLWFRGALDVEAFYRTLEELIRRHESLRTSFPTVDGRPVQIVHDHVPLEMPFLDLSALAPEDRTAMAEHLLAETVKTPFDITQPRLLRLRLLRLEPDHHELIQVEQHFIHDGWSFSVLLRELKAIYPAFAAGLPSPLPELEYQYADFAAWQREWMEGPTMRQQLDYWLGQLAGSPGILELPTDRPRPAQQTFRGQLELQLIPKDLYLGLRDFSRREGFTLFMTALAGFYTLLSRYTGQTDILLGTTNANRRTREIEALIGMIVNSIVLRGDLHGNPSFRTLLERVRQMTLESHAYQDMPLDRLVQELNPERQLGRNPLFQVMFNFHDAAVPELDFGGLEGRFLVRGNRSSKMDLNVIIIPRAEQIVGQVGVSDDVHAVLHWEYSTELFERTTTLRMIEHYKNLLRGVLVDPTRRLSDLPMLADSEQEQLRAWALGPRPALATGRLHDAFAAQVRARPNATALVAGALRLSYAELDAHAEALAARLRAVGVGPEVVVGVCLDRSAALVVGLLGVLKAGGAYLPLDAEHPRERLAGLLEDSGARVLLTRASLAGLLPGERLPRVLVDDASADPAPPAARGPQPLPVAAGREPVPGNAAYVIYTSGSTGKPKGVVVSHGNAVNFLASMAKQPGLGADDVLVALTTISFDIAGLELWLPLSQGARVVLADRETAVTGDRLSALLAAEGVTVMQATPATWRLLLASGWPGAPGLKALSGGEALPADLVAELAPKVGELWNVYGPTETTIWSTVQAVPAGTRIDGAARIGRPIDQTVARVLDALGQPVPEGVFGELLLGGAGVARGYLERPGLTAERFVPDPFATEPGARLYRTGDLARWRPEGELEFAGRRDFQVKLRGYRIELGEIEAALRGYPGVREAVVVLRGGAGAQEGVLVAYVAGEPAELPGARELEEALAAQLPAYMVPAIFVPLERLPLSAAGKIDRKALPAPDLAGGPSATAYEAPRNATEEVLVAIWQEVLGAAQVGVHDDFFALGGHSLSAARVLARVRDAVGVELVLPQLFERRRLAALAELVASLQGSAPTARVASATAEAEAALLAQASGLSDAELDALLAQTMNEGRS
jgi:amino acid adenylation domain-containing protein